MAEYLYLTSLYSYSEAHLTSTHATAFCYVYDMNMLIDFFTFLYDQCNYYIDAGVLLKKLNHPNAFAVRATK